MAACAAFSSPAAARIETEQAGFGNCRRIGKLRIALRRGHRERTELSRPDQLQDRRQVVEHQLYLAGEKILHSRRTAFVGDVENVDTGALLEQFAGDVPVRTVALRGIAERAGLCLGECDQLLNIPGRNRRMNDQNIRDHPRAGNGCEVGVNIVGQLGIE
jgi:hypothetical protein